MLKNFTSSWFLYFFIPKFCKYLYFPVLFQNENIETLTIVSGQILYLFLYSIFSLLLQSCAFKLSKSHRKLEKNRVFNWRLKKNHLIQKLPEILNWILLWLFFLSSKIAFSVSLNFSNPLGKYRSSQKDMFHYVLRFTIKVLFFLEDLTKKADQWPFL